MEGYGPNDYLVVVPSIRPVNPDYLQSLREFSILICDDSDGQVDRTYITQKQYLEHGFRNIMLAGRDFVDRYIRKEDKDLFPQHCPSVKDVGLYLAHKEGYLGIILIDDDVDTRIAQPDDFLTLRRPVHPKRCLTESGWLNTLKLLRLDGIYARGYPYEHRGEAEAEFEELGDVVRPLFNQGLWMGTPDINGIDKLALDREWVMAYISGKTDHDNATPWHIHAAMIDTQIALSKGQKLPLSIMNCQIDTSLISAFWQPPDYQVPPFRVRRHDDIWSMYFLKKVMDLHGYTCTVGSPVLWHRKAGNPLGEILSEHVTNLIQPVLTKAIDSAADMCGAHSQVAHTAMELAEKSRGFLPKYAYGTFEDILRDYFTKCLRWAKMLE